MSYSYFRALKIFSVLVFNSVILISLALIAFNPFVEQYKVGYTSLSEFKNKAKIIEISGFIDYEKAKIIERELYNLEKEKHHYLALILRINSPGGTAGGSSAINRIILNFKEKTNMPVYAVLGEMATSGGYYVAISADKIFSDPSTLTGSIGVIYTRFSFGELFKKLGVQEEVITAGRLKGLLSKYSKVLSENEREFVVKLLNQMYDNFFQSVLNARKSLISKEELNEYAQGQVFVGNEAKKIGLVDAIGGLSEVIEELKQKFNVKEVKIDEEKKGFLSIIERMSASSHQGNNHLMDAISPLFTNKSANFSNYLLLHQPLYLPANYFRIGLEKGN